MTNRQEWYKSRHMVCCGIKTSRERDGNPCSELTRCLFSRVSPKLAAVISSGNGSLGLLGGAILFLYGIIATRQEFASFGKIYAADGGVFIVLAVLWGWGIDHRRPDFSEWIGAAICLVGVTVMLWKR